MQLDAPVSSPYLPASHSLHESSPTSAYLPASQSSHPFPSALGTVPAPHDEQLVAPALLYVPSSHSRHPDCPVADWYSPAKHALQSVMPVPFAT